MPELPEVETVRAGLEKYLLGAIVTEIDVLDERSLKRHLAGSQDFRDKLVGSRFTSIERRGKFLWIPLDSDSKALVGHLGMSGQMLVRLKDTVQDKLTRVVISLTSRDGEDLELRFVDQRLFGSLMIDDLESDNLGGQVPHSASHIALDPLDERFNSANVIEKMLKRSAGIKKVLLDQQVMSGVGNIYADETLWRSKLHYDIPTNQLSIAKLNEVIGHATDILKSAVQAGGTSFDEQYKNVNGESGYFEVSLNAYGQAGKPCARCGKPMVRDAWMNRGSHYCPNCQKLPKS